MAEQTQVLTLQQRMAALNMAHMNHIPGAKITPILPAKPQIPLQRPPAYRTKSINNPPAQTYGSIADSQTGNLPNGPPPLPNRKQPPPLPTRKNTQETVRRTSAISNVPTIDEDAQGYRVTTTRSKSDDSVRRVSAPGWGEVDLPALPEKKPQIVGRKYSSDKPKYSNRVPGPTLLPSPPVTPARQPSQSPSRPTLPPRVPSRKPEITQTGAVSQQTNSHEPLPSQSVVPQKPRRSALEFGMNKSKPQPTPEPVPKAEIVPQLPTRPQKTSTPSPPPVPLSSRPEISSRPQQCVQALTNTNGVTATKECMVCRDFSKPDHHAALFPRQQISSLQSLAQQLTSPFTSLTDKARAIFTWLHHNIRYDVDAFFSGNLKGSTPQSTLQSGLAVCEGFAGLFTNLATYAGLESIVISGNGKGFGYEHLAPGSKLPPFSMNHAWNAVKIDHGEWKLIDPCWGAGHVQGHGQPYQQKFDPKHFTMSNEQFGISHFPENKDHFFLPGGRRMTWEEYTQVNPTIWPDVCETPTVYTNAKEDYGIGDRSVLPRNRAISISQPGNVRFQFGLVCPHWTLTKHTKKGLPPVFLIQISGRDGRNQDMIPLEHVKPSASGSGEDVGGDLWYVDIPARDLGAPGQTLTLFAVRTFGDRQDCRGLTVREFKNGKGRVGMSFTGVAAWDLTA